MKYIIFEQAGLELPLVFPDLIEHKVMAGERKVVSAGFVNLNLDNEIRIGGDSLTLNVKSRPQDAEIITKHLKNRL
jgi:hypothetical protein